jgi:hypothetical protein
MAFIRTTKGNRRSVAIILLVPAAIASAAVVASRLSMTFPTSRTNAHEAVANGTSSNQVGKIITYTGPDQCQTLSFDNKSGRVLGLASSCEQRLDTHGVPLPPGTSGTLKSISESFR